MTRFFRWWAATTLRVPFWVLFLAAVSVVLSLNLARQRINFSTDRTGLLNPDHPVQRSWQRYQSQFEGNSDLLVLI